MGYFALLFCKQKAGCSTQVGTPGPMFCKYNRASRPRCCITYVQPSHFVCSLPVPMLLELTVLLLLLALTLCKRRSEPNARIARCVYWLRSAFRSCTSARTAPHPDATHCPNWAQMDWLLFWDGNLFANRRNADPPDVLQATMARTSPSENFRYLASKLKWFVGKWSTSTCSARALTYKEVYLDYCT
jgi:hypothetical protein